MTIRIAMWSGPRNISTAMMRSWENRNDCDVVDEPFYAVYLNQTQSPHPGFEQILASQSQDPVIVANQLSVLPTQQPLQYQKHMTHHMLEHIDLSWAKHIRHCFLIRSPDEIVNSYTNSRGVCNAQDIGIIRQAELYQQLSELTGQRIPVIDSNAVLANPEGVIRNMCVALGVEFQSAMLNWPAGSRASDGVWASHWYHSVERSTQFATPTSKTFTLNESQREVVEQVMPYYLQMKQHAIE